MQLWDQILPGKVLHVPYERLVRDAKGTSRKLLEHCGLGWDDAVLDFHKTSRTVQTASLHQVGAGLLSRAAITSNRLQSLGWLQVRKQLYTSSIGKWQMFKEQLQPAVDRLHDIIEEYESQWQVYLKPHSEHNEL